jgi:hypothetical protein
LIDKEPLSPTFYVGDGGPGEIHPGSEYRLRQFSCARRTDAAPEFFIKGVWHISLIL